MALPARLPLRRAAMSSNKPLIIVGGGLAGSLAALAIAERRPDVPLLLIEGGDTLRRQSCVVFLRWRCDRGGAEPGRGHEATPLARPHDPVSRSHASPGLRLQQRSFGKPRRVGSRQAPAKPISAGGRGRPACRRRGRAGRRDPDWGRRGDRRARPAGADARAGPCVAKIRRHRICRARPRTRDADHHGCVVDQSEGYRFVYSLPFSGDRLLVEDTYYTE